MSKKLIAVASAAALALTALVGVAPATSAVGAFSVAVASSSGGTGLNADVAYTVKIPTQDVLRFNETSGDTTSTIRLTSTTPGTTDTVRLVATGGIKVLSAAAFGALTTSTNNTKAGSQDVSVVSVDGNAIFYVYSTSTTAGTVTFSSGSNSQVIYVKGITPAVYNVTLVGSLPTLATSADTDVDFTVTDAFGNVLTATQTATITRVGNINLSTATSLTYDTVRKTHYLTVSGSAVGGASIGITLPATKVETLGTPKTFFGTFSVGGTQAVLITALQAQVATLTAQLAVSRLIEDSVTQNKYNTLARKWNKANPGAKVALKK
jgi:hypothetical protein